MFSETLTLLLRTFHLHTLLNICTVGRHVRLGECPFQKVAQKIEIGRGVLLCAPVACYEGVAATSSFGSIYYAWILPLRLQTPLAPIWVK